MKVGDRVQFLSEIGGGKIAGFQGKNIALVEDSDGFQIPTPVSDLVVMGSGDEYKSSKGVSKVNVSEASVNTDVDTDTFNMSVKAKMNSFEYEDELDSEEYDAADREITFKAPVEERKGGNILNLYFAFIPTDMNNFSKSSFDCYLVNDSNFYAYYIYLALNGSTCVLHSEGEIEPNTKVFVETLNLESLADLDRVRFQVLSFKRDKEFVAKPVIDVQFRIDKIKFTKLHAFKQNAFFDKIALLYPIVENDEIVNQKPIDADKLVYDEKKHSEMQKQGRLTTSVSSNKLKGLESLNTSFGNSNRSESNNNDGIIVVDLHADAILETTTGMGNSDILNYQLDYFRRKLDENKNRHGQKLIFIHGKGEGVLRRAIINELKYRYKSYRYQDASFQEYGYGATQVTIK